jgi:hypothetical protein
LQFPTGQASFEYYYYDFSFLGVGVIAVPHWPGLFGSYYCFFHFFRHRRHCSSPLARLHLVIIIVFFIFLGIGVIAVPHWPGFVLFSILIFFTSFGIGIVVAGQLPHWPGFFLFYHFSNFSRHRRYSFVIKVYCS